MSKPKTERQKYSLSFQNQLELGDLIEFKRRPLEPYGLPIDIYSHWGVYFKDGLIVHFHQADSDAMLNPFDEKKFKPGAVDADPLKDVAHDSDIVVENKLDITHVPRRTTEEIRHLLELIVKKPGLIYSLIYFNCENFAVYVKFKGIADSKQMIKWNAWAKYSAPNWKLLDIPVPVDHKFIPGSLQHLFNTYAVIKWIEMLKIGAIRQWDENMDAAKSERNPENILEKMVAEHKDPSEKDALAYWRNALAESDHAAS